MQDSTLEGLEKFKKWFEMRAETANISEEGRDKFLGAVNMIQEDIDYVTGYEEMVNSKERLSKPFIPTAEGRPVPMPLPIITPPARVPLFCGQR